jgi:flagellar motility protein MotE (MotC chaperone)
MKPQAIYSTAGKRNMDNYKNHFKKLKNKNASTPNPGVRAKASRRPSAQGQRVSLNYSSNKVRGSNRGSYVFGAICAIGFCAALFAFVYPEQIETIIAGTEISFFAQGEASETPSKTPGEKTKSAQKAEEKSAEGAGGKGENKATSSDPALANKTASGDGSVEEKPSYIQGLVDKEKDLDEREKKLVDLEEKLQLQKIELDKKIEALEATRRDIASRLESRVNQDEEDITKLVGVYSNMKAQNAATVISKLDDDLAVKILKRMKKQDAGNILNFLDPEKAKLLSEKYSGY